MCYDVFFKAIFTDEVNILAKMVSDITGIDYEILKDNVILETNEIPISTKNEKAKRCDFILRVGENHLINLELNSSYYSGLIAKNLAYLCSLFSTSIRSGEEYNEDLLAVQINLNSYKSNYDKALSQYQLQEVNSHKLYTKSISIFTLNVVNCHELYYNLGDEDNIPNYIKWGALIYCDNFNDVPNIVKGIMTDKERDKIMSKLSKLTRDDLFYTEEEALEWVEWERRSIETAARKKGIEIGEVKGREQEQRDLILSMNENGVDLELISKVTGKTIDEIKKIIEE